MKPPIYLTGLCLSLAILATLNASADEAIHPLGNVATAEGWQGFQGSGGDWKLPGTIVFEAPAGPKGWWQHGFRTENDGTINCIPYSGLVVELENKKEIPIDLTLLIKIPPLTGRQEYVSESRAKVRVAGAGPRRLYIPWSAFDFQQAAPALLKFIQKVEITGAYSDGSSTSVKVTSVALVRGDEVALDAPARSRALPHAGSASYPVTVYNCGDDLKSVALSIEHYGWEAMAAKVEPDHLDLAPGACEICTVTVNVPDKIPPGGQEKQTLLAVANGGSSARLELITARDVVHPYLLHTAARWEEVREKVKKYDWAKRAQDHYVQQAELWQVPEMVDPATLHVTDGLGPYLFTSEKPHMCRAVAIAWQLTRNRAYAEKVALFLQRMSDPVTGYASTLRGCHQGLVHEGEVFSAMASAYDMILDAELLTAADREQIDKAFRLLIDTMDFDAKSGGVSNWGVDEFTGAMECALMVGDLERAWRFYSGPNGVLDQAGKGILDDGWWFECSVNYNSGMAHAFTDVAIALEPWGIDLKEMNIPANFSSNYSLVPWSMKPGLFGMAFEKWGPNTRSYRRIRDLWDGFLPFVDYRGIMFATNDSDEKAISGGLFESAYYVYRDPRYAGMIKFSPGRDLLWAVPDLPAETPEFFRVSAVADNAGIAVLRSQTPDRPQREQIQAVLKYGTHGGYHGHFDRISMLSLMRYGRSFFNPEMAWYGYSAPLYKFYGQTSIDKNMVVVDQKMQEPVECKRLLFHTGPLLQAVAAETKARWSNPPFMGGMTLEKGQTYEEILWQQGHWLPIPHDPPSPLIVTEYTEPIVQRRLLAVTDDYVVIADYLKAEKEHTFDNLLQIKGFQGIEAMGKKWVRHTAQMNSDPLNSAQLITDCDWYDVSGPAVAKFEMEFGAGGEISSGLGERNQPGILDMDVYSAWPESRQMMVGATPESLQGASKRLQYTVTSGTNVLAGGRFGAWVLGQGNVDVPVQGCDSIELQAQIVATNKERKMLFWANPRLVTADGKEIPVPAAAVSLENTDSPAEPGKDYYGGPIKIAGNKFDGAMPAEPLDAELPSKVKIDLRGLHATRFKTLIGADYPFGDEAPRRKTYSVRAVGKEARFLTVIEAHEGKPVVQSVKASSADQLLINLKDGRQQRVMIKNLDGNESARPSVVLEEITAGKVTRSETSDETPQMTATPRLKDQ